MDSLTAYDSNDEEEQSSTSAPVNPAVPSVAKPINVGIMPKPESEIKKGRRVLNLPMPSLLARTSVDEDDEDDDKCLRSSLNKGSSLLAHVGPSIALLNWHEFFWITSAWFSASSTEIVRK
jgi:hypothetical protein